MAEAPLRRHALTARQCWCAPRMEHVCQYCSLDAPQPSCERCGGTGWEPAHDAAQAWVIIHHDVEYV